MSMKKVLIVFSCLLVVILQSFIITGCGDVGVDAPPKTDIDNTDTDNPLFKQADSIELARLNDSLRVVDLIRSIQLRDSMATVDSIRYAQLLDSLRIADSIRSIYLQDSLTAIIGDSAIFVQTLDSLRRADSLSYLRMLDSLGLVRTLRADSLKKVADSLKAFADSVAAAIEDSTRRAFVYDSITKFNDSVMNFNDSIKNFNDSISDWQLSQQRRSDTLAQIRQATITSRKGRLRPQILTVIGFGYDVGGAYALSDYVKNVGTPPILDINKLLYDENGNSKISEDINVSAYSARTITGSTVEEYQQRLSSRINVNAKISGYGATFSTQISNSFASERSGSSAYAFATYQRIVPRVGYVVGDVLYDPAKYVTESFNRDVQNLSADELIRRYGTHVILGAILGGRIDYNMSIAKRGFVSSSVINTYVSAKAEARIGIVKGSGEVDISTQNQVNESFVENSEDITTKAHGGSSAYADRIHSRGPLESGVWEAWVGSVDNNMVFCEFYNNSLFPLSDFVPAHRKADVEDAIRRHLGPVKFPVKEVIGIHSQMENLGRRLGGAVILGDNNMGTLNPAHTFLWKLDIESVTLSSDQSGDWFRNASIVVRYTIDENGGGDRRSIYEKRDTFFVDFGGRKIVGIADGYRSETRSGFYAQTYSEVHVVNSSGNVMIQSARVRNAKEVKDIWYHIDRLQLQFYERVPNTSQNKVINFSKRR